MSDVKIEDVLEGEGRMLAELRANEFCKANAFSRTHQDEFDIYYEWAHR